MVTQQKKTAAKKAATSKNAAPDQHGMPVPPPAANIIFTGTSLVGMPVQYHPNGYENMLQDVLAAQVLGEPTPDGLVPVVVIKKEDDKAVPVFRTAAFGPKDHGTAYIQTLGILISVETAEKLQQIAAASAAAKDNS